MDLSQDPPASLQNAANQAKAMTTQNSFERLHGQQAPSGSMDHMQTHDQSFDKLGGDVRTAVDEQATHPFTSNRSGQLNQTPMGSSANDNQAASDAPSQRNEQFFKAYASHLRVQSKVDGLFKLKQDLKLPNLVLSQANIINNNAAVDIMGSSKFQRKTSRRSDHATHLRNLSALRSTDSIKYIDTLDRNDSNQLNQTQQKQILNDIASSRSLMLANTPRQQQIIAMVKGSQTSRRLNDRSMVNGVNARIKENRYSSLRNSPSGSFLIHPKSRIPDHPAELLLQQQQKTIEAEAKINPSFSLTNIVQARNFINATPIFEISEQLQGTQTGQNTFNQRSMSLQPAPYQDQYQQQQIKRILKFDQSALSVRIQQSQLPEKLGYPRPTFSDEFQKAIDDSGPKDSTVPQSEEELREETGDSELHQQLSRLPSVDNSLAADLNIDYEGNFSIKRKENITAKRSPLPSQKVQQANDLQKSASKKLVVKQSGCKNFKLPELTGTLPKNNNDSILSPQASSRTVFGTKRRSEAINSRNVLNQIIQKTAPGMSSRPNLLVTPDRDVGKSHSTPKGEPTSGKKRGPLRALLDSEDKNSTLEKPRIALENLKFSPRMKAEIIEQKVAHYSKQRVDLIHERNKPKPKLKLFSPYKRKSTFKNDDEEYDFKQFIPYNTELAFEALDTEEVDEATKNEHMALLKNFIKKMENNNVHFQMAFTQQSQHLQTIIRVLDMQQNFQKDPTSLLGFKNYSAIKQLYLKQIEDQKAAKKKLKIADGIAGDGVTTMAQTRTDFLTVDETKTGQPSDGQSQKPPDLQSQAQSEKHSEGIFSRMEEDVNEAKTPMPSGTAIRTFSVKDTEIRKTTDDMDIIAKPPSLIMAEEPDLQINKKKKESKKRLESASLQLEGVDAVFVENSASIFNSDEEAEKAKRELSKKTVDPAILVADAGDEKVDDKDDDKESSSLKTESSISSNEQNDSHQSGKEKSNSGKEKSNISAPKNIIESDKNTGSEGVFNTDSDYDSEEQKVKSLVKISEELAKKSNKRRNTQAFGKLKGLSNKDIEGKNFIQISLVKQSKAKHTTIADDASSHSGGSYQSDEEENASPLRRMKLKKKEKLKTQISVPTSTMVSTSDVIVTDTASFGSRKRKNSTVIEEISEKSTSELLTETDASIHSVPQSQGSIGVHDLYIGKEQFGKPMVQRKGRYAILKRDILDVEMPKDDPRGPYQIENSKVKQFIQYCEKDHEDDIKINPYPMLHSLAQGHFIIKNQTWTDKIWLAVIKRTLELAKATIKYKTKIELLYLQNCPMSDSCLSQIVKLMLNAQKLKRIVLVDMTFGPMTTNALLQLNKSKNNIGKVKKMFAIDLRNCKLINFEQQMPDLATNEHPMIVSNFASIRKLTLVDQKLQDGHLQLLLNQQQLLDVLDFSYNRFTTEGLIKFVQTLNKTAPNLMNLRSINFAGNSLKDAENELHLQRCLWDLIQQTYIQHVNLSNTSLKTKTAKVCMKALVDARSIQSLHLTSPNAAKFRLAALKIFKRCLFDYTANDTCHEEIPETWNAQFQLPRLNHDDINHAVASSILGTKNKQDFAARQKDAKLTYDEQRLVLSRLMGRNDLSEYDKWIRSDELDTLGRPVDIRENLSPEIQKEIGLGRRQPSDLCWIMSQECWICEMWSYYMPIISKQDIAESDGGISTSLIQLTETQERVFEKMISQKKNEFEQLDFQQPYIIGNMTRQKFVRLDSFQDHMLSLDVEGDQIRNQFNRNSDKIFQYYRKEWSNALKRSSQAVLVTDTNKGKNQLSNKKKEKNGITYPYKPHTDRGYKHQFSEYDVLWTTSLMTQPGKQGAFLIYKYDAERVLKAHFTTFIPVRPHQIVHHHVLPKVIVGETFEQREARRDQNYYFDVFAAYSQDQQTKYLTEILKTDLEFWDVPYMQQLQIVGSQGIASLTKILMKHAQELLIVFKRLQTDSTTFPLLDYFCILGWIKQIGITAENFTTTQFTQIYEEIKIVEKKAASGGFQRLNTMRRNSLNVSMNSSLKKKKNKKDPEHPTHSLHRFQFLELLVRIAICKYGGQNSKIEPSNSFENLIMKQILPSFKVGFQFKNPGETKKWIEYVMLNDRDLQKLLFLNQFSLKKIYDRLSKEQHVQVEEQKKDLKPKRAGRSRSFASKKRMSSMAIIREASEAGGSPSSLRRGKSNLGHTGSSLGGASQFGGSLTSPKMRRSGTLDKTIIRNSSILNHKEGIDYESPSSPVSPGSPGSPSSPGNRLISPTKQLDTQQSFALALKQTEEENGKQQDETETSFFHELIKQNTLNETKNSGETGDTKMSINIQSKKQDLKLISGQTSFKGSSLKKKNLKEKKAVQIKNQFVFKKDEEWQIRQEKLFEMTQQTLPEELKKLFTQKVHQKTFTWVKTPIKTSGKTHKAAEKDAKQQILLSFTEFMAYLVLAGEQINKLQIVSGMDAKDPVTATKQILLHILPYYNHELHEVPEDDTRGLFEHQQDILIQGKVVKFNANQEEPEDPAYLDMLSEGGGTNSKNEEGLKNDGSAQKYRKNSIVLDKWQMLADERAKHQSPPRKRIDPNVPNQELIDKMLAEKKKRIEREAYLKELARRRLEDNDEDSDD